MFFLGLLFLGPLIIVLSFPFICAYGCFESLKKSCYGNCNVILRVILSIFAGALGILLGLIALPVLLIIGLPTFIYSEIKSKKETKRNARDLLDKKFKEAQDIQK